MTVSVEARLKELVIMEQKHAENVNKLRERINKLESEIESLKKPDSVYDKNHYLMSIDESLKFIKSYMSIDLYTPYSCDRPQKRSHINPYFK